MDKLYPSHALENAIRERGYRCDTLWETKGPRATAVAWMVCYLINGRVVIVQTGRHGEWEAFTSNDSPEAKATVDDVLARCGLSDDASADIAEDAAKLLGV